ncbi:hypothetical protein N0B31_02640 [Salinirubellus salinus]|uniref:DUF7308 domain-containing protein n=1 Tax=Salinirubellus salinus TaxID=1364945 RepID=A0A9E7UBH5_9EURY|nr:hypothetical protein [Salinirubellus salinus]UWM55188.1 hypothetical protein N0B31_02640 [Salinirubellus salinus]
MRLPRPASGQAEVLGLALLLGLLVLGTTAVLALGGTALDQTQSSSRLENAEHSMTLFDSRAAMVALGGSGTQTVSFGRGGGDFRVDEGSGELRVIHVDYDGNVSPNDDSNDETLYSGTLGQVVYTSGDTEVAYQAGGVWRKGEGAARMVSPPEFHYRSATLTLPVVVARGSGGAGGGGASRVTLREVPNSFEREYPDEGQTYSTAPSRVYDNPVQQGFIRIEVESEYYEGWAEYFRSRTDGKVSSFDTNETARLDLITIGTIGDFTMQSVGDTIPVRGFPTDGHSLNDFQIRLRPDSGQSSNFNNLMWSMSATSDDGQRHLELAVNGNGAKCGETVTAAVYYSDDGTATYEGWTAPYTVQCSGDDIWVDVDFTDSGTTATYESLSGRDGKLYSSETENDEGTFLGSSGVLPSDDDHGDIDLSPGETRSMAFVVPHYFSEFGTDLPLTINEGNNAGQCYATGNKNPDCEASAGYIDYPGSGKVVTYLHVTENGLEVEFD